MSPPSTDPACKYHQQAAGLAVCTACGADICGGCHGFDRRGLALCPPCRGETHADLPAWEDPSVEYTPSAYAATLWELLRNPRDFFDPLGADGEWLPAVGFGLVSLTIGLLINTIWKFALIPGFEANLAELASNQGIAGGEMRIFVFLSIPFAVVLAAGIHTGALKTAVGVAGGRCPWRTAARIAGYSLGACVLLVAPPIWGFNLGRLLAVVWIFNLETSALRRFYGFGPWRAMLTVLLPVILMLVCGM